MRRIFDTINWPLTTLAVAGLLWASLTPAHAQDKEAAGVPWRTGGFVETGAGYDIRSGTPVRSVVDFEVPGSVGTYPLKASRTLTTSPDVEFLDVLPTAPFTRWRFDYHYMVYAGQFGFYSVVYPNGTVTREDGLLRGVGDRLVFGESGPVLLRADGGRVFFSRLAGTEAWVGTQIVDPFNLVYTVTPHNEYGPARVTDPSGRYIELTWSGNKVTRVASSAGQSVTFTHQEQLYFPEHPLITRADYPDGTRAIYTYSSGAASGSTASCSANLPLTLDDTRAQSKMQYVRYTWQRDVAAVGALCVIDGEFAQDGTLVSRRQRTTGNGFVLHRETSPTGEQRYFKYYAELLGEKTDFLGNTWFFEYDDNSFLESVQDPRNNVTTYVNEPLSGKPREIRYPDNTRVAYTYSSADYPYHVATITDERNHVTTYQRFPNNVVRRVLYPDGSEESWEELDAFNQPRLHTLRNGAQERFSFDTSGRLRIHWLPTFDLTVFSPSVSYTYYPDGHVWEDRIETKTDPRGYVTRYDYDTVFVPGPGPGGGTYAPRSGRGLITLVTHPDQTRTRLAYTNYGKLRETTDELGNVSRITYDDFQRVATRVDAENRTTTYGYRRRTNLSPYAFTAELPTTIALPSGKVQTLTYDVEDRLTLKTEGTGSETAATILSYDAADNLRNQTDPMGRVTSYTYDSRNRTKTRVDPGSRTTVFEYDDAGNLESVTNPDNTITRSTYDAMNRVLTKTSETNLVTTYEYTDDGLIDFIVDPVGKRTGYDYDAMGRIRARTSPGVGAGFRYMEEYRYDPAGNLEWASDNRNVVTTYQYDSRNRETSRTYSDGTPGITSAYDNAGRLTRIANSVSAIEYTYDRTGQTTCDRQIITGPGGVDKSLCYTFDFDGNRELLLSPDVWLGYDYNTRNQVKMISELGYGSVEYEYNLDGQPRLKTFGNGATATYSYDTVGRLSGINESHAPDTTYGYDTRSRRISSSFGGGYQSKTFAYYADSKLRRDTRVNRFVPNGPQTTLANEFVYDDSGNRRTTTAEGTYVTNWANQYTRVGASETFAYDNVGNMTRRGTLNLSYDAESRLTGSLGVISFLYDPLGRIAKIVTPSGSRSVVYDGEHPITWYAPNGQPEELTYWGARGDEPFYGYRFATGESLFYHLDAQNNVVSITDLFATRLESYEYSAYGEQRAIAPAFPWAYRASTVKPRYGFNGQVWIPEINLYHYKARAYDPRLGRFLQHDPSHLEADDPNLYRYVLNNPVNYVDSTGEILETLWDIANVVMDVASLAKNVATGNYAGAAVDAATILLDGAAAAAPGAPAIVGPAVRAGRAAEAAKSLRGVENVADGTKVAGDAASAASDVAQGAKATEQTTTVAKKVGDAATDSGRAGKQERLRELANDPNTSSADRGWIRQEQNAISRGNRSTIRVPPGKELAHARGREAAKGFSHTKSPSSMQSRELHRTQHKFDDFGRKNKPRP